MRSILNGILAFIGSTSLTDEEFDALTLEDTSDDNLTYLALSALLVTRESVSTVQDRLRYYFLAKGATIETVDTGSSNILIGDSLCS